MARTTVMIVGSSGRKQGVSKPKDGKPGRPYDFFGVYFTFEDPSVVGQRCSDAPLQYDTVKQFDPDYIPKPGDVLDAYVQYNGFTRRNEIQAIFDVGHA